jgi:hypothetical protein
LGYRNVTKQKLDHAKRYEKKKEKEGKEKRKKGVGGVFQVGHCRTFPEAFPENILIGPSSQLTPYLHTCGNDCIRREGTVVLCSETSAPIPPDDSKYPSLPQDGQRLMKHTAPFICNRLCSVCEKQ